MRSRRTLLAVAAAVAAGAAATVTLPAAAATTGCSVTYAVQSEWTGGFTANVAITGFCFHMAWVSQLPVPGV